MSAAIRFISPGEDRLTDRHFSAIANEVERRAGIKLPSGKRTMVEGRLRKRVKALGLGGLIEYGIHLFDRGGLAEEIGEIIDCLTTNKTDFFREPAHFEFIRKVAVPEIARHQKALRPSIKVWSAAASTGAEAYTAAMVLQDLVEEGSIMRYAILGTDISTEVLREADAAIYPTDFVEPVPKEMRRRYLLQPKDQSQGIVRIVPELRARVDFRQLNLMDASYPFDRDVDVIFCRNVLIYFEKPVQKAVVTRLASHLRPGGFLILGHAESMAGGDVPTLSQYRPTIFQRTDA